MPQKQARAAAMRRRGRPSTQTKPRVKRLTVQAVDPSDDLCGVARVDRVAVERVRAVLPPPEVYLALAETFRALGDPTRLQLLTALAEAELCVCDLSALVGVSESAVSHSLRTLRQLRLVRYRRAGKIAYYSLDDTHVAGLVAEGLEHMLKSGR